MATQQRVQRVREAIKQETSDIIQQMKDPRIGFVTVTDAEVSRDLRHVKIFVSVLGDEESKKASLEGLERATGYIRTEIGQRIRLRHTPEIIFRWDESLERGARISRILRDLKEEDADIKAEDGASAVEVPPSSEGEDA
ncbi:MAG: 30S ribosome-binding factor RbfA [Firmicutes bacterium]|nr:30S ribosome-binding factor RbfA [Bacillota bacterium]